MKARIQIELEYDFPEVTNEAELEEVLENVELPDNYVSDSFEIVEMW